MGEKLKNLATGKVKGVELEIEINKPDKIGGLHSIHFQSGELRLDFDEKEYLKITTGILSAKKKLLKFKGDL